MHCGRGGARGAQAWEIGLKPVPFAYVKASALSQVHQLLDRYGDRARILAGGQSLMAALNLRLSTPEVLIDITGHTEQLDLAKDLDPFDDIHATAATKLYLASVLLERVVRTLVK